MGNEEFLSLCKAKVAEYTNAHMDKTDQKQMRKTVRFLAAKQPFRSVKQSSI